MKIALVNKRFSLSGGGAERYAVDLANALMAQGHEVDCYGNTLEDLGTKAGLYKVRMYRKPGWLRILSFNRNFSKLISGRLAEYDIVYALTQAFPADLYFMGGGAHEHWLSLRFPDPYINFLKRLITPVNSAQLWLENKIYRQENCRAIIANSELVKCHAEKYGAVPPERVFVVHNGIDDKRFNSEVAGRYRESTRREFGISSDEFVISYLSHNWERKGLKTILEAMALLRNKANITTRILVGGRGDAPAFRALGLELGLEDSAMIFLGSYAMPERLYVASEVSILPTMYDPCAGVTVEAMACGIPAITTPENGSHELIRHGITGYVLSSYAASEELSEYLLELQDREKREAMGAAASRDVSYRNFKQVVAETVAVMRQVAAEKKRQENNG